MITWCRYKSPLGEPSRHSYIVKTCSCDGIHSATQCCAVLVKTNNCAREETKFLPCVVSHVLSIIPNTFNKDVDYCRYWYSTVVTLVSSVGRTAQSYLLFAELNTEVCCVRPAAKFLAPLNDEWNTGNRSRASKQEARVLGNWKLL